MTNPQKMLDLPKKKIIVYFICIFTLLYLFVQLLVVRLFLFLFFFDKIVIPQTYRTVPKPLP